MLPELIFAVALVQAAVCDDSGTTPAVNACLAETLKRSEARLQNYLKAALRKYDEAEGHPHGDAVQLGIGASQTAFEAYRSVECSTVAEDWKGGTIRGAMSLGCQISLTDKRTHDIWNHWLRYMDSTPPILPEPKPTN